MIDPDKTLLSLLQRGMARPGGYVRLTVRGACMTPIIRDGDRITVSGETGAVKPGDLALIRTASGGWACHRLLGFRGRGAILAGDHASPPSLHAPAEILGKVVEVVRGDRMLIPHQAPMAYLAPLLAALKLRADHAAGYRRKSLKLLHVLLRRLLGFQWYLVRARPKTKMGQESCEMRA